MKRHAAILGIFAIQTICAVIFVFDIVVSVLGLRTVPITWQLRELIEIGAALGLILGTAMGIVALRRSDARRHRVEEQLKVASGAFSALIAQRFDEWALTSAERDVALFSIKGLNLSEMAALRGTSEGTIKAQTAAVYRKAGVSGRAQLLSLFVDDLMSGVLLPEAQNPTEQVSAAQ
ncbi:helix-turn-helix transcriptional regulator [Jannaschia pohangensis]|uniref:HTH luxR-type domain-containing protein n=1 Tax=Jannaschia pohangensis TaxID=390807 RepID=A0A1I3JQ20_9RHOB|nr:response regulator transcription factor [Jannaschia pohangensis]SFI62005.1 hypothetical protein SAMN04488095_1383 [Jannaschia pohangensis]